MKQTTISITKIVGTESESISRDGDAACNGVDYQ